MPDRPEFVPAPILAVTWDTVIGANITGYEPDTGSSDYEEVTLGDRIVSAIAAQQLTQMHGELERIRRDALQRISEDVARLRSTVMREEISALVRQTMTEPIRETDGYGRPRGEPTTLHELMRQDVKTYLGEPERNRSYDEQKGGFRALVRECVTEGLTKDLRDEILAARKKVAGLVQGKVAELMATALETGKLS